MKAKVISSFAAGLIVAAGVCGVVYYTGSAEVSSTENIIQPSEEEMKSTLTTAGYHVLTDDEWKAELAKVEIKLDPPQEEKETVESESPKDVTEKVIYKTILNVASGMTSIDVGHALVQGQIIDNAQVFFNEVEKRGVANNLRPGTYELDSEVTMDDVIGIVFK